MGITGEFGALGDFAGKLRETGGKLEAIAEAVHPRLRRSLQSTMGANQDPYGNPWPPKKEGGRIDTSGYSAKVQSAVLGRTIRFELQDPLQYHHDGVPGHMPPRPILPNEERGIPSGWKRLLADEVKKAMSDAGAQEVGGGEVGE